MNKIKSSNRVVLIVLAAISFAAIPEVHATVAGSLGVRGGFDFESDQMVIGFQSELGKVIQLARFAPSADYSFGGDVTNFAFNGDVRIYVTPPGASATIYGGVGPTFFVVDSDGADTDSKFGLTLSGGVKFGAGKGRTYNVEGRFGVDVMPDFRLLFGIYF